MGNYLGAFGVIPILLGINEWLNSRENQSQMTGEDDEAAMEEMTDASKGLLRNVVLVTISNGADNLGVYIPLFASYTGVQMGLCVIVFALDGDIEVGFALFFITFRRFWGVREYIWRIYM